jgi:hypothetical protein
MKFPGFLSKPRWLSKDAATRRSAVAHDADADLLANLGRLAREDPDAEVRIAALKRLADPGVAQGLAHDDADENVRRQARALWLDLLTGTHASAPALAERLRLLKAQDDAELIERIARHAREAELRAAALERVSRPALLFERAVEDPDAAIRLALVERIDDEAQLTRLAERARKSDKQVNRLARARIDALRIARGDLTALEARARQLCERLEQLLREPAQDDTETRLIADWSAIEATVAEPLRARFRAAQALLATSRMPPAAPPPLQQEVIAEAAPAQAPLVEAAETVEAADTAATTATGDDEDAVPTEADVQVEALVAPLLAQARFAASLDEAQSAQRLHREQQQAIAKEIEDALQRLDTAIDAGASAQAHTAKAGIDELRKRLVEAPPRALAQRIATAEQRYAELARWQHWADDQRRLQLCEDIEGLPSAGLHPDALAARVREAQVEWTRLEATEKPGARHAGGLGRRFHSACRAALAPAQSYFKKRQELRESHAREVTALVERVDALPAEGAEHAAVVALRRDVVEALRGLDRVEPRERKALAQTLKTRLTALDTRVAERDNTIERAKAALIAEAEALGATPQRGAPAAARQLQQRWQQIGNGRRARDQAQWQAFRAALDGVFARLDAERAERSARDDEQRTQAEALCADLEALAADAAHVDRGAAARLRAAWDALRVRDDALERRFAAASAALRETLERHERQTRNARFDAWRVRYRLCRHAEEASESPEALRERWDAAATTDVAAAALARRFETALTPPPARAEADACRDLLIELEILAGIESPPTDGERRRALQVERLAARLRGADANASAQPLTVLLERWTALGALPDSAFDTRFEQALEAALATL